MFEEIKSYYQRNLWSKKYVYNVVGKAITKEEYELIVGEKYE